MISEVTEVGRIEVPGGEVLYIGAADRNKRGVEEEEELEYSDISIDDVIDDNLESAVSGTEYGIRQGPDSKVMGITHGTSDRSKLGGFQ